LQGCLGPRQFGSLAYFGQRVTTGLKELARLILVPAPQSDLAQNALGNGFLMRRIHCASELY
jgi:hypothetical protein